MNCCSDCGEALANRKIVNNSFERYGIAWRLKFLSEVLAYPVRKILYLVAMYTGIRAAFNNVCSICHPPLLAASLNGESFEIPGLGRLRIRVRAKRPRFISGRKREIGMISIHMVSPKINRLQYALLRLTSHFGCGHVEIVFFEADDCITCFGIRDILRSNIARLGLQNLFRELPSFHHKYEVALLTQIFHLLSDRGFAARLAPPEKCVSLAVNQSLVNPKKYPATVVSLTKKYRRLANALESSFSDPGSPSNRV